MKNKCVSQVTIPEIDNEALECDEFISSKCVTISRECKKVGNLEGESLDLFVGRLCSKLVTMDNEIALLQRQIRILNGELPELPEIEDVPAVDPPTDELPVE